MSCANKIYSSTIVPSAPTHFTKSCRSRAFSLAYRVALVIWYRERRGQRKALLELDDRMLADIGITRSEAIEEGTKPFWR
jgi:uncharacterized protein YjiS (DUF1127 family)